MVMDAIALLRKDHRTLKQLLNEASATTNRATKKRKQLLTKILSEIKLHTTIEEKIFYPSLQEFVKTREVVLESYESHHYADKILSDLKKLKYDDETWKAKLMVLKKNIFYHISEEENDLFPLTKKLLSPVELKLLGEEMQQLKESLSAGILSSVMSSLVVVPPYLTNPDTENMEKKK